MLLGAAACGALAAGVLLAYRFIYAPSPKDKVRQETLLI